MVSTTADYEFLTTSLQQLLLLIYHQERVNFKSQKIFSSQQWFNQEIEKLVRFQKVDRHNGVAKDGRKHEEYYTLNSAGKLFVYNFIIKYNERLQNV